MIWDELDELDGSRVIVDPADSHHRMTIDAAWSHKEVLVPVFRGGERVHTLPPALAEARDHPATSWARSTRRSSASAPALVSGRPGSGRSTAGASP